MKFAVFAPGIDFIWLESAIILNTIIIIQTPILLKPMQTKVLDNTCSTVSI